MATQPAHDRLETHPFWQVQTVFDPDGTGADFAYTIGLHTRGLPELHIWARPSEGDDPGVDWMLTTRDRGTVLNELAGLMVAGRPGVSSEITHEYDGGHTRVSYRVDPPGDREELQAFGVPDGVDVLPVRWSLHRAPEGPVAPHAITVASAAARPHGRSAALANLHERVHELVESMTTAPAAQRRWRSSAQGFDPEWWQEMDRAGRQRLERNLGGLLHDVTLSCLAVEAVADVADEELLLAGRGPWVRGVSGQQFPCGPAWEASAEVLAAVRDLLASVDARGLTTIAGSHAMAMTGRVEGLADYPEVCGRLLGWATVSAAVCPRRLLDELPAWQPVTAAFAGAAVVAPPELHEWASCLASALTHRMRLSADDVQTFTFLYEKDLPQLSVLVNGPFPTTL